MRLFPLFSGTPDTTTKLMAYIQRNFGLKIGSGRAHTKSEPKRKNGQKSGNATGAAEGLAS